MSARCVVVFATGIVMATGALVASAQHGQHGTPEGWKFSWPAGDPEKGREVFTKLECSKCHEVKGEAFATPTDRDRIGPELSSMAPLHESEYFAEAIINPSAVIEKGRGYAAPDGTSKMPSFNDSITVQDVVDLVAFLRSLTPPAQPARGADPGPGAGAQPGSGAAPDAEGHQH